MKPSSAVRLLLIGLTFMLCRVPQAQDKPSRLQIPDTDDGLPGAGPIRRYDWFRKLWSDRRTAWAARLERDRNAVVLLGDSITQGWGDRKSVV